MSPETLTLVAENGSVELPGTTLLVAVDDTGHDLFARTHESFGLGGCACLVRDYGRLIDDPWRQMKARHFGGSTVSTHAAELREPTVKQMQALAAFFENCQFFRYAVIAPRYVDFQSEHSLIKVICGALMHRIADIAAWTLPTQVAIVMERSQRIEQDLVFELSGWRMGDGEVEFEPRPYLLPKSANSSLLEVADFIIHTAGTNIKRRSHGHYESGRDFTAVFRSIDSRLSYYSEICAVKDGQA